MGNPQYLAMTAAEFALCKELPEKIAWMACHFSPYGFGLSNRPKELPPGSILMINDRIEPTCHNADLVAIQAYETAEALQCSGILLDFQRPGNGLTQQIAVAVTAASPNHYAKELDCAVFLPPPPLRCDTSEYFSYWQDREIWLETYEQWETVTITEHTVSVTQDTPAATPELPLWNDALCCRYKTDVYDDRAVFSLHRGVKELQALHCYVTNYVGLYQEYRNVESV